MDVMQLAAGLDLGPSFEDLKRAKMQDILRGVQAAQVAPPSPMFSEQPMVPPPQMPQPGPQTPMRPQGLVKALGKGPGAPMPQQAPGGPPGPVPGGPAPVDPAQARLAALQAQMEGLGAVDRSGMEASFKRNQEQGGQGLLLALAAQEAGNQPIASHYLQKARAAGEPIKTAGGTMTEGGFIEDVDYGRQREEAKLQGQIAQQQAIINSNATREEKERAQKALFAQQEKLANMNNAAAMGRAQVAASGAVQAATLQGKEAAKVASENRATVKQSENALYVLEQAKKLIPESTSSLAGQAVDMGLGVIGKNRPARAAQRELELLSGTLISTVPRMQGPQSDKDVLLYKQMAGDLARAEDPDTRMQIANRMVEMHRRAIAQAGGGGDAPPATPAAGGGGQIAVNPQTGEKLQLVNGQWVPVQ